MIGTRGSYGGSFSQQLIEVRSNTDIDISRTAYIVRLFAWLAFARSANKAARNRGFRDKQDQLPESPACANTKQVCAISIAALSIVARFRVP
jgi:hypothetical protein